MTLTEIRRYPLKSCRGETLESAIVKPWGLDGDRRWMLVDEQGAAITAREVPRLVLIDPTITSDGLLVRADAHPDLVVVRPDPANQTAVHLWSSHLTAAVAGTEADAWFTSVLGRVARLVWLDDPRRRPTSPEFSGPDDRVSLADGYPLLLATEESLAALNDAVLAGSEHARERLPMTRFRPNVVVAGAPAWDEDDWRRIRIGETTFRAVKGCARCAITTIDPQTGVREKEPIASLARIRRFDAKTWFAINLVPDVPLGSDAEIRVGDTAEVLDAVAPGDGPIRPAARQPEGKR